MTAFEPGSLVSLLLAGGLLDGIITDDDAQADDQELLAVLQRMEAARVQACIVLLHDLPRGYTLGKYYVKPRRPSFYHYHSVAQKYWDDREYIKHYRINKATFVELVNGIRADVQRVDTNYKDAITAEQKLSICHARCFTWRQGSPCSRCLPLRASA
jgi:hypothetical protein